MRADALDRNQLIAACFWAVIILVGIAIFNIHSCRSDLKSVVGVLLLPEHFIVQAHSKVESRFDRFEPLYFLATESAAKRNTERGRFVGVDSYTPTSLMNRVGREAGEGYVQKLNPGFGLDRISGDSARIDKFNIDYQLLTLNHFPERARPRAYCQSWTQAFELQRNSVTDGYRAVPSGLRKISEVRVVFLHPFFMFTENIGLAAENLGLAQSYPDQAEVSEYEQAIEYYFGGLGVVFFLDIVGIELDYGRYAIIGRLSSNFGWLYLLCENLFLGFLLVRCVSLRN